MYKCAYACVCMFVCAHLLGRVYAYVYVCMYVRACIVCMCKCVCARVSVSGRCSHLCNERMRDGWMRCTRKTQTQQWPSVPLLVECGPMHPAACSPSQHTVGHSYLRNACSTSGQSTRFSRGSHVFSEWGYPFHLTRYSFVTPSWGRTVKCGVIGLALE